MSRGLVLAAYGLLLAAVSGGGAALGAAVGPNSADSAEEMTGGTPPETAAEHAGDYELELATTSVAAGAPARLALEIHDADGRVLTVYDVEHEKELHLIVVSRDLRTYAHLHPSRDAAGTWTVTAPALPAGPYRVFADFVPAGGERTTLGADLGVAGEYEPQPVPAPSRSTVVDGYEVSVAGELVAGAESEVAVTIARDGEPVTDLTPYLGALGHLVAIRDGDLDYLHVHPLAAADGPGGPTVEFAVDVAGAGTYGLFFDFEHDGEVRTAAVVVTAGTAGGGDEDGAGHGGDAHG